MSAESEITNALNLFDGEKMTLKECRDICIRLGSLLRNEEVGKTQRPVIYYIFGRCNEHFGNNWGAARAFKKITKSNASEKQRRYAGKFIVDFVTKIKKEIDFRTSEINRFSNKVIKMQMDREEF